MRGRLHAAYLNPVGTYTCFKGFIGRWEGKSCAGTFSAVGTSGKWLPYAVILRLIIFVVISYACSSSSLNIFFDQSEGVATGSG